MVCPVCLRSLPEGAKTCVNCSGAQPQPTEPVNVYQRPVPSHGFDAVVGLERIIEALQNCVIFSELDRILGVRPFCAKLFYGPPGCGKTFLVQAFANETAKQGFKFFSLTYDDLRTDSITEAEARVEKFFREIEENAPCVALVDDIDKICRQRIADIPVNGKRLTASFLSGYSSVRFSAQKIILIGTTRHPEMVDEAFVDKVSVVRFLLPDSQSRERFFALRFVPSFRLEPGFTWSDMANETEGYCYRDITGLCEIIENSVSSELTRGDFMNALRAFVPSPKEGILQSLQAWETYMTNWWER